MNLKLPVDVHLAVSPDGSLALLVGGLDVAIKPTDLPSLMSAKPMRNGPRTFASGKRMGRPPARMCRYGDAKAAPGKKLCPKHQAIAVKSVAKARAAKKRAAS
jgi:hypothetical protein